VYCDAATAAATAAAKFSVQVVLLGSYSNSQQQRLQ
jgi:hypothetical protein